MVRIILRNSSSISTVKFIIKYKICLSLGLVSEVLKNPEMFDIIYHSLEIFEKHFIFENHVEDVRKMVLSCKSQNSEEMRVVVCMANCKSLAREYYNRCIQENVMTRDIYYWLFAYGFIEYDDIIYDYGVPCKNDFSSPIRVKDEKVSDDVFVYYLKSDNPPRNIARKIIRYRPHLIHHMMYMKHHGEILENLQDPDYLPFFDREVLTGISH